MTDKLKAILEGMGCEGVEVGPCHVEFDYKGNSVCIDAMISYGPSAVLDIDITEGGG